MNLAGVVILYYPDEHINDNIRSYLPQLSRLYIIDNSEKPQQGLLSRAITALPEVVYLNDGINHGIAERLNRACSGAIEEGFSWLLTMDQDSYFEEGELEKYLEKIQQYPHQTSVSMFGARYYTVGGFNYDPSGYQPVNNLITSGSLVNLRCFEQLGGFDENLFIDEVDHEYCYRSIVAGFNIILVHGVQFRHQLGEEKTMPFIIPFFRRKRSMHSPLRIYYMLRNFLYIRQRYEQHFAPEMTHFAPIIRKRITNNLFYGRQQVKTIRYLWKAFTDYKKGRMGKIRN